MKLYMTPGACSLADHIALAEAGIAVELVKVDLRTRKTEHGDDFTKVNPKGYVPALVFDDGEVLTENVAIIGWVCDQTPKLTPPGALGKARNSEMLAFLATEIHRPFMRSMFSPADAEKQAAREAIAARRGVTLQLQRTMRVPCAPCAPTLMDLLEQCVERAGVSPFRLPSGAGHDAMMIQRLTEVCMLFVRCGNGGISHNPLETMTAGDAQLAARVFLDFVRRVPAMPR